MGIMARLRQATEDDVDRSLENAPFDLPPQDESQLLQFFNLMLDVLSGEGIGTDE
jgi:hypothetical protein